MRSLKSLPRGGRAIRTRRPSRCQRRAHWHAAASPAHIAIGSHDHVAHFSRKLEAPEPRRRERCPGRMAGGLHGCKAGLDPFADQQHLTRIAKPGDTAATRAEHHPLRLDGCLPRAIAREKGAQNREWGAVYGTWLWRVRLDQRLRNHGTSDALRWACDWLAYKEDSFPGMARDPAIRNGSHHTQARATDLGSDREGRSEVALGLWRSSVPAKGTPVKATSPRAGSFCRHPDALRFNCALKHLSGGYWPAMVALVTHGGHFQNRTSGSCCGSAGSPSCQNESRLPRSASARRAGAPARSLLDGPRDSPLLVCTEKWLPRS